MHGTLRFLYLSHLLYGICVKIFQRATQRARMLLTDNIQNGGSYNRLRAVSLFSVVRRTKREKRKWPRAWLMARDPRFARLAASPLPRACIAPTKSEEKERLLAVYHCRGCWRLRRRSGWWRVYRHWKQGWSSVGFSGWFNTLNVKISVFDCLHPILVAICDVLNGFQNRMQTINNDLINSCKKTCYSIGGRHDRSAAYIP